MYAIIETGGKQYKVKEGTTIDVEKLPVEAGNSFNLDKVLLTSDGKETVQIGQPYLVGVAVKATVVEQTKGPKVVIFKYKRKTGYRRKTGHRQELTRLKIESIVANNDSPAIETTI